jgi:hypothetical protein
VLVRPQVQSGDYMLIAWNDTMPKPTLSITRLLIDPVLERASRDYDIWLNRDDHILTADE